MHLMSIWTRVKRRQHVALGAADRRFHTARLHIASKGTGMTGT